MTGADFDHTSFAVHDALAWARRLRRELGATPIAGETLPTFRYLLLHLGTAESGGRIELIEPVANGFLTRYLDRRGEGPHHITFTVPDLRASVDQVRALGATVTGEDYSHPSWQEAFIAPDRVHGVVIQLAQSDCSYPSPAELLASTARDTGSFPSSAGATDPTWWVPVWDTPAGPAAIPPTGPSTGPPTVPPAVLGATTLASTDLDFSHRLFEGVLGAQTHHHAGGVEFAWPSGRIRACSRPVPGVTGLDLTGGPANGLTIGTSTLRPVAAGAGGIKRSGFGRELGPLGTDEFVNERLLYVKGAGAEVRDHGVGL